MNCTHPKASGRNLGCGSDLGLSRRALFLFAALQLRRPMRAKDRSSFGPQSIHPGFMTGIGKYRRPGISANPSGLRVPNLKSCATVFTGNATQSLPGHRVLPLPARQPCKAVTEKLLKAWNARKDRASWGGGTGKCTVEYNWNQQRSSRNGISAGSVAQLPFTEKTDFTPWKFTEFSGTRRADHSAVLRDWSCDSNVAQYSRSEASSA